MSRPIFRPKIPQWKMNILRERFISGTYVQLRLAKELKVSTKTTYDYYHHFMAIRDSYPEKLTDMDFYLPLPQTEHRPTTFYQELIYIMPLLIAEEQGPAFKAMPIWRKYKKIFPNSYSYSPFKMIFYDWMKDNIVPNSSKKLVQHIPDEDIKILRRWRHTNNHREWQISTTLFAALNGATVMEIMSKVDAGRRSVNYWITIYNTTGLSGFKIKERTVNEKITQGINSSKDNLVKLMHETPKAYNINRTSWSFVALTQVYNQKYDETITYAQIRHYMKQLGYKFKKSRDMLTSQDPNYREKINKIQHILQKLKPDERFFSIDEYGPVTIKIKGGIMIKHKTESPRTVPHDQKIKGVLLCTAALELATNQITHFYSPKKNSLEMIKLIDLLIAQYKDQKRLYICWDAVSWHNSHMLLNYIKDLNYKGYREQFNTPEIKLAPLPSCTQFLNVIESVFAGLAKAVIHNSDYGSVEECKQAIDLHFKTRNEHFLKAPKHAGNKIWGKEIVAPRFSETNHCRKTNAMRGAR
jgi:transposase